MNRIERMLTELCPNGVPSVQLREVCRFNRGRWIRSDKLEAGTVPVVTSAQTVSAYHNQANRPGKNVVIASLGAYAGFVSWWESPFYLSNAFTVDPINESSLDVKYLFYVLKNRELEIQALASKAGVPNVYGEDVGRIYVQVPPVEIQRAIVDILDTCTKLEAELEARKAQYTFWRDTLLTFPTTNQASTLSLSRSLNLPPFTIHWLPMGEVGTFIRGQGVQKSDFVDEGVSAVHYGQIHTRFGISVNRALVKVSEEKASRLRHVEYGDLLIATTSEDCEAVAKAVAWLGREECVIGGDAHIYRHALDPKYVSYFFSSKKFHSQKKKCITGEKVRRISWASLSRLLIPVPPFEVQQRIADVLDSFDALVNDLTSGLPAEITARRQQYEHYREQLLTFPEKK